MARSIDKGGQDIALYHMEKIARNNKSAKEPTLKEQIAHANLPADEKRKRMASREWNIEAREYCTNNPDRRLNVGAKLYAWVSIKFKADFEQFHKLGAPWSEIRTFVKDKENDFINL
jgi:hypothetical protein